MYRVDRSLANRASVFCRWSRRYGTRLDRKTTTDCDLWLIRRRPHLLLGRQSRQSNLGEVVARGASLLPECAGRGCLQQGRPAD